MVTWSFLSFVVNVILNFSIGRYVRYFLLRKHFLSLGSLNLAWFARDRFCDSRMKQRKDFIILGMKQQEIFFLGESAILSHTITVKISLPLSRFLGTREEVIRVP